MKLREYFDKYGIKISAFADRIGVSRNTITRALAGKPISLEVAMKIEKGTEKKVKCQELLESDNE